MKNSSDDNHSRKALNLCHIFLFKVQFEYFLMLCNCIHSISFPHSNTSRHTLRWWLKFCEFYKNFELIDFFFNWADINKWIWSLTSKLCSCLCGQKLLRVYYILPLPIPQKHLSVKFKVTQKKNCIKICALKTCLM